MFIAINMRQRVASLRAAEKRISHYEDTTSLFRSVDSSTVLAGADRIGCRKGRARAMTTNVMRSLFCIAGVAVVVQTAISADALQLDVVSLAKKARPAVLLLVVSNAAGEKVATGTGFLVSSDGKLITNRHVVEGGASVVAKAEDGSVFTGIGIIDDDVKHDLVLMKVDGKSLPCLRLGISQKVEIGSRVVVVGSPLGLEGSVSEGIVSAVREFSTSTRLLQTTAAISHGSSGSPVLNSSGDVIGVATSQISEGQSLNFAVPVEAVKDLLERTVAVTNTQAVSSLSKEDTSMEEALENSREDLWFCEVFYKKKDYLRALHKIRVLLRQHPNDADLWSKLADVYSKLTLYEDAARTYEKALIIKPDDAGLWLGIATAYERLERFTAAVAASQRAIKIWPEYKEAWLMLAGEYKALGRTSDEETASEQARKLEETAIESIEHSLRRNPNNELAWTEWRCLGKKYSPAQRISFQRELIRRYPNNANVWLLYPKKLGLYEIKLRDGTKFEVMSDRDPTEVEVHDLSRKFRELKSSSFLVLRIPGEDWDLFCEGFIRQNPENKEAWKGLLLALSAMPNENMALSRMAAFSRELIKQHPKNLQAWTYLSVGLIRAKKYTEALPVLDKAIELNPKESTLWAGLAYCHSNLGNREKMVSALEHLQSLDPKNATFYTKQCERTFGQKGARSTP